MDEILAKIRRTSVEVSLSPGMSRELRLTDFVNLLQSRIDGKEASSQESAQILPAGTIYVLRKELNMSVFMYIPATRRLFRLRDKYEDGVVHEWTIPVPNIIMQIDLAQEPDRSWCLRSREDVHLVCTNAPVKVIRNWIRSGWTKVITRQPIYTANSAWKVFPLPFGNVFRDLDVCWGSSYKQTTGINENDLSPLEDWYDAYFNSIGNHDLDILGVLSGSTLHGLLRQERSPEFSGDPDDRDPDETSFYAYFDKLSEYETFPYDQFVFSPG